MDSIPINEKRVKEDLKELVVPIMKTILPPQFIISDETVETMADCVRELASALSCEALTIGALDGKARITGFDICSGIDVLGLGHYNSFALHRYLHKRQQHIQHCKSCAEIQSVVKPTAHREIARTEEVQAPSGAASAATTATTSGSKKRSRPSSRASHSDGKKQVVETAEPSDLLSEQSKTATEGNPPTKKKPAAAPSSSSTKRDFSDPKFMEEIISKVSTTQDKEGMVRSLAKEFHMTIRDIKALLSL